MFSGIFVQSSSANELFHQVAEERQEDDDEGDEKFLKFPRHKPQNFQNTPTTKMAVNNRTNNNNNNKAMKVAMSLRNIKDESLVKKTPSLEQQMNLARRACWCSSKGDGVGGNGCCENCFKRYNTNNGNDDDDDDIAKVKDTDAETETEKTTMVLNGAKLYSKNINTNDNTNANANANDNTMNSKTTTTLTTNSLRKRINSKHNNQDVQPEASNNDAIPHTALPNGVDNSVPEDDTSANDSSSMPKNSSSLEYLRMVLLTMWLAFVAFCDRNTIKRNDPRFEVYRQTQLVATQIQTPVPVPTSTQQNVSAFNKTSDSASASASASASSSSSSTTSNKNKKLLGQFKVLTSKKVIFLFLVCLFFSCLHRIEARPNSVNGDGNAISSAGAGVESVAAAAVAGAGVNGGGDASTAKSAGVSGGGGSGQTNHLTSSDAGISSDNTAATQQQKYIATGDGTTATTGSHSDNGDSSLHAGHVAGAKDAHEEGGSDHPDRYPLAQVEFDRVKTPFIIGVWILSASIAKIGFHMTPKLHLIFPESCLLIVVGVVIGVVLFFCTDVAVSPLTPNTFFFYMLPPIILDAGYFMPNRLFFDNLGTILLMAVVGTIFNISTIGTSLWACGLSGIFGPVEEAPRFLDLFLFSSLISAVDPVAVLAVFEEIHVNEILYIVVFGESLLNDAVTVVMYHMMEMYNHIGISELIAQDIVNGVGSFFVVAIGGTVIGIIWGFLTGLVTRFTDHVRVIEPIFIFVMAYLAYLNAEIFHMSGILAITFCGITMKNYVESNISQKSHTTVKYALKMLSSSSETIIFMFLGVATVNNSHVWNTWFVLCTIVFCSVFRVIGVIILTALANRFRLHKLSRVDQFVMSYGGLRGAVAFALVLLIDERIVPQKNMFVTTTIAVIYFTVFLQGITIKPLVKILNVKRANKRKPTMNERIHERFMDHLMAGIEDIVGKTGSYNVRDKFKRFDTRFIRPLLIRDLKGAEPKIIETYSKLTMRDAIEVMRRNPSTIGQITGTESMSALFRNYTNNCIGGRWAPPTIYTTCPSLTNLDNTCSRNLDMHELDYNPSKKDLTDAKIHHLLAEELKPYRRHRRLSYSRHAVDDRDLSTQVNYKMQMNFRRMFNDRKHHKRSKRGANKDGVKQNHVSFHDFQQNGTTKQFSHGTSKNETKLRKKLIRKHSHNSLNKYRRLEIDNYINEVLNESAEENPPNKQLTEVTVVGPNDDWDDGLTFTAKSSLAENVIPEEDRNFSRDSDGERRVATPTATESQLPWKRQGDEISDAVQQNEFPAWASNKEYLAYNSPSATFLGGINKPKQPKSVIGLFRRESSGSRSGGVGAGGSIAGVDFLDGISARGSDPALAAALSGMVVPSAIPHNPRLDKRSQSISAGSSIHDSGHSGPFPVTASHRRNVRRGSMLELSGDIIPEESYYHGHSKSLCEPAGEEWDSVLADAERTEYASGNSDKILRGSGREPLLPKLTPRAQIRRGMSLGGGGMSGMGPGSSSGLSGGGSHKKSHVTTALLSTSNSDYDDDDDEDFDLYDDENIVVTTTTVPAINIESGGRHQRLAGSGGGGGGSGSNEGGDDGHAAAATTTTTTIRLTRNNDESII